MWRRSSGGCIAGFAMLAVLAHSAIVSAVPINDDCAGAFVPVECQGQAPDVNIGVCSVSQGPPNIKEVCDLTMGSPPARDCSNPAATCQVLPPNTDAYRCRFATDNQLSTTDGPQVAGAPCQAAGVDSFQADIWYHYVAPCDGTMTIHNCGANNTYDSMLQVFSYDAADCVACPLTDNSQSKTCSDDNCGMAGAGSAVRLVVAEGGCYTIRLGSFSESGTLTDVESGVSGLDIGVVCNPADDFSIPPAPAEPPHDRRKNRYISFVPNNPGLVVAFRVQKTTTPTGSCWVQTPVNFGQNQHTAKCDANPVFRVWTEPVVHVGDCEIIPVADYLIHSVPVGGVENPAGLTVGTILLPSNNNKYWADTVGHFDGTGWTPPNQFTTVNDLLAIIAYFSVAPGRPHFTVVNLQAVNSTDSCLSNIVSTADVLAAIVALSGGTYGPPTTTRLLDPTKCPPCG